MIKLDGERKIPRENSLVPKVTGRDYVALLFFSESFEPSHV